MSQKEKTESFYPTNKKEWRKWLQKNHLSKQSVWLESYKKESGIPSISWSDAVDEALCFGWIDSKKISIDKVKSHQFFSKRKAKSTWSKINKAKVEKLITKKKMTPSGLECIKIAKENGSWEILDSVEELIIPNDLEKEFKTKNGSKTFFLSLSKSVRKAMLQWLVLAVRPETRQKRITELVELAAQQKKPKQF
jgi:uncharacterized protein YdeI (YjbR/CyaY-like superfamily)